MPIQTLGPPIITPFKIDPLTNDQMKTVISPSPLELQNPTLSALSVSDIICINIRHAANHSFGTLLNPSLLSVTPSYIVCILRTTETYVSSSNLSHAPKYTHSFTSVRGVDLSLMES